MKRLLLTYLILTLVIVGFHWSENAFGAPIGCEAFRRLVMTRQEAAQLTPAELIARGKDGVEAAQRVDRGSGLDRRLFFCLATSRWPRSSRLSRCPSPHGRSDGRCSRMRSATC